MNPNSVQMSQMVGICPKEEVITSHHLKFSNRIKTNHRFSYKNDIRSMRGAKILQSYSKLGATKPAHIPKKELHNDM
jgi:hypothetical protein